MKKISIIIPVYNTEKYLEQCINSILDQNFTDYEIILVNDGSTDSSGVICEHFSEKFEQIKTIHKINGGLSDARNQGLKEAKGEYILFIDSDDFIEKDSLNEINKVIEEDRDVDLIFLSAVKWFNENKIEILESGYNKEEIKNQQPLYVLEYISKMDKFPASACTKLIKRSFINDNRLYFEKDMLSEDIDWTLRVLIHAKKFNYYSGRYYYYRQNRIGSITNSLNINNFKSLLLIINKWIKKNEFNPENNIEEYINAYLAYEYVILLTIYGNLSSLERENHYTELKKISWILKYSNNKKVLITQKMINVLGIKITSKILFSYLKLR